MKDLSSRRHHEARIKDRARRRLKARWMRFLWGRDLATDPKFVGRHAATPCSCSAECCGNARRYCGPTRQEMLANGDE